MREPKVLFLDIEATDLSADIGNLLSIGYKFAHWGVKAKPKVLTILQYPGKQINDDSQLLKAFEPIFEEADLVVHHFGDYYDVPFLQTRRLIHKMKVMPNVKTFDTWKAARKKLKFGSNRLENIAEVLGCPFKKTKLNRRIWADARVGIKKAIAYVVKHNHFDVLIEEFVYNKIQAVFAHPRLYANQNYENCPSCGHTKSRSKGRYPCEVKIYQRRICLRCGRTWKGKEIRGE